MTSSASGGVVSVVIVGCGRIAGGYNDADAREPLTHVVAYQQAGARLVGCCDRDASTAERFARRWSIQRWGTDPRTLFELVRPDLVSICTPPDGRLAIIDAVCRSVARAVLIEKPIGATQDEARAIADRLASWGRPALVNYLRAFDPTYTRLHDQVRAGQYGRLKEIVGRYYGTAATNATHLLERVLALAGPPAATRRLSGSDDAPLFELRWEGGLIARFLPTDGCAWSPFELDLLFDSSRVRVIDAEERTERFVAVRHPRYADFITLSPEPPSREQGPAIGPLNHVVSALIGASRGGAFDTQLVPRAVDVTRILELVGH